METTKLSEAKALSNSLYEVLAEDAGWRLSPAHDGWISDDYQDNPDDDSDGYEVANTAEDVCFCYDVAAGDEASKLAAASERYAAGFDEMLAALKQLRSFYGAPRHASTEGQRKAMANAEAVIAKAEGQS